MTGRMQALLPRSRVGQLRLLVLVVAMAFAVIKLILAATTGGTNDVYSFEAFANAIRHYGPIDIYGYRVPHGIGTFYPPYNHPPLVGWMLVLFNWLTDLGISFRFLIRVPATLADVVTSVLVFELVRSRRPLSEATVAGVMVACSPALIVISGYHGNTDPIFVMLALTSLYLLVNERSGFLAGVAFAAAISIKIVPIVALPVLLLIAARSSRRRLLAFLAGIGALLAVLWGPLIPHQWAPFAENVLAYKGLNFPQWGLLQFARTAGSSPELRSFLRNDGRYLLLMLSAGVPLLVAWRRPAASTSAFGLSLVAVLLLSTSTGGRYVVWAVAAAFLVDVWAGVIYNAAASYFLIVLYSRWNGDKFLWNWDRAISGRWTRGEVIIGGVVWLTLLAVALLGLRPLTRWARRPRPSHDDEVANTSTKADRRSHPTPSDAPA